MANTGFLQRLMGASYHIEMIIRRLYRNSFISGIIPKVKNKKYGVHPPFDFKHIITHLKSIGIKKGDILIVHSAYRPLKASGLKPDEIIDQLLDLIGPNGTLVMPVIRGYPESPPEHLALKTDISNIIFEYNVKKSKVWTGILPITLKNRKGSVTSRFPLNTVTAFGHHASDMIKNELNDDYSTPNGINSAWKYCTDKNAVVISLGTDLTHSLTMIHTAEDVDPGNWPVKNWYREVKFNIVDDHFQFTTTVLERHPKWGMLHFGERKLSKDLIRDNIITSVEIEGLLVESLRSKNLFDYLNAKNSNGYPYFWLRKHIKKT